MRRPSGAGRRRGQTGEPKSADGVVEMMRALRVARRSALKARTQAANRLRALLFTAPEELKAELRGLPTNRLVTTVAARFRPGRCPRNLVGVTKLAMRSIARRHRDLSEEISALDERLERLAAEAAPAPLVALKGVGTDTAVSLLIAAGDNPERLRSEAAFAHLCGVAPVEASDSGRVKRHRLNRGGNREANRALYVLVLGRMSWDERTRGYVSRRTAEGKSKREIIVRCLKRFVAREIYRTLTATPTALSHRRSRGLDRHRSIWDCTLSRRYGPMDRVA